MAWQGTASLAMVPAALLSSRIEELKPVLKSGWLGVHTSFAVLGDAAFAFAFIVSVMYLIQERQIKAKKFGFFYRRLPSLSQLDTLNYWCLTIGFPLFTGGIITGSRPAEEEYDEAPAALTSLPLYVFPLKVRA